MLNAKTKKFCKFCSTGLTPGSDGATPEGRLLHFKGCIWTFDLISMEVYKHVRSYLSNWAHTLTIKLRLGQLHNW